MVGWSLDGLAIGGDQDIRQSQHKAGPGRFMVNFGGLLIDGI